MKARAYVMIQTRGYKTMDSTFTFETKIFPIFVVKNIPK